MEKLSEEELMANDVVYWIKNDISCLHMIAEIKKELKPLSKERYDYYQILREKVYEYNKGRT